MQRFKTFKVKDYEYKVDRLLIIGAFTIILILLLYTLYLDNWSGEYHYYAKCNIKDGVCVNPFFNSTQCSNLNIIDTPLCTQYVMFPGQEFGTPPSLWFTYFNWIVYIVGFGAILSNTLIYNKGFFKYIISLMKDNGEA
jgi:hypothetical protein